jgi:translation initiation factor 5B
MSQPAQTLRQPVVVVLGHVDSGKTSFLDRIRGTAVQAREAGGITQEIGASFFPMETLTAICGALLDKSGAQLKIPGLLVIDTPGHEIFSNLRMRGGSAADIAILLVDVNKGLENQTIESINILKQRRVPFLVALNKIDMIRGWRKETTGSLASALKQQPPEWNDELEERLYNVVGSLSKQGFDSDAFYRVKDFRKQVSIVPISARYGVGMPEIMAVLIGLAQQFLTEKLVTIDENGKARGIILELQEEIGIGETANVILTDGKLRVGDRLVLMKRDGAVESRVKALFMPKPLDEMRDPRDKFTPVQEVYSAAGVKLVSPDLSGVIPGTPIVSFRTQEEFESAKAELEKELTTLVTKTDKDGVVVKAGSIGGLEALLRMLEQRQIPIKSADIGDISRNDIVEAEAVAEHDPYLGAIIGFDVKVLQDAKENAKSAQIVTSDVIYDAVEGYVQWAAQKREEDQRNALLSITPPAKIKALPGSFFRRNDPAVFGIEVIGGRLKPKVRLMDANGVELGTVEQIQDNGKPVAEATKGMQVAISVRGPTLGRQIKENDDIFTFPTSRDVRLLREKLAQTLTPDDEAVLEEIVSIRSTKDTMYGF